MEAAIEAALALGKVAMSTFVEVNGVMGTRQRGLGDCEHGVEGAELVQLVAVLATADDGPVVHGADARAR